MFLPHFDVMERNLFVKWTHAGVCEARKKYKGRTQGGGPHKSRILTGYYGFNANISFTFQTIKNLYAHPTYLCFGPFCTFFGLFLGMFGDK